MSKTESGRFGAWWSTLGGVRKTLFIIGVVFISMVILSIPVMILSPPETESTVSKEGKEDTAPVPTTIPTLPGKALTSRTALLDDDWVVEFIAASISEACESEISNNGVRVALELHVRGTVNSFPTGVNLLRSGEIYKGTLDGPEPNEIEEGESARYTLCFDVPNFLSSTEDVFLVRDGSRVKILEGKPEELVTLTATDSILEDGIYQVGNSVKDVLYYASGGSSSDCRFIIETNGKADSSEDTHTGAVPSRYRIELNSGDIFRTEDCGRWQSTQPTYYDGNTSNEIRANGAYVVGEDYPPGKYVTKVPTPPSCMYEVFTDIPGRPHELLTNGGSGLTRYDLFLKEGSFLITHNCGDWVYTPAEAS